MEIRRNKQGSACELRLSGRLDANQALVLDTELQEVVRGGEHRIHLHMADVGYISSAGIRILIKYAKMLKSLGGSFQVLQPSPMVAEVIEMTGLGGLLGGKETEVAIAEPGTATTADQCVQHGPLRCTLYREVRARPLTCRLVGNPGKLGVEPFTAQDATSMAMPAGRFALGLGALGTGFEDCQPRYGEFLAAGGVAACLPSDDTKTPDFLAAAGSLVPEVRILYAMVGDGSLPLCVRFESENTDAGATLSEVVRACLEIAEAGKIGMVMVAETSGLIGASLRRSPAQPMVGGGMFDHPAIRQWFSLTPERVCDRSLALVTGFAAATADSAFAPFSRPLAEPTGPVGHFHASAFSYRALPMGSIPLEDTVGSLFENQTLIALMHLLNDNRPIVGAGESLFVRGVIWLGEVETMASDSPEGKDTP